MKIDRSEFEEFCRVVSEMDGILTVLSVCASMEGLVVDDPVQQTIDHVEEQLHKLSQSMEAVLSSKTREEVAA